MKTLAMCSLILLAAACGGGGSTGTTCSKTQCGFECVDITTDPRNCGACAKPCAQGNVCVTGMCMVSCPMGLSQCNGTCANLDNDPSNCGMCKTICPKGNVCAAGKCGLGCPMGQDACSGSCVNLMSDAGNCGACAMACGQGSACVAGKCSVACPGGQDVCAGKCTYLTTDAANCGMCGNACGMGESCVGSACKVLCPMGQTACKSCVDTNLDPANCGGCNKVCGNGFVCSMGKCVTGCQMPLITCNNMMTCVDPRNDPDNCMSCGMVCPMVQNAQRACAGGNCGMGMCNPGFLNCDGQSANGCEVSGGTDINNCGSCAKVCGFANATPKCVMGTCAIASCAQGFGDCDGMAQNGCETNTNTSQSNCGACGSPCNGNCINGKCVVAAGVCPPMPFSMAGLPATLPASNGSAYGALTFDGAGNLLAVAAGGPNSLYSVANGTGKVTVLTALPQGHTWVSIAYLAATNTAYVGNDTGDIESYNLTTTAMTAVTNIGGQSLNALAFAPASFGAYGGQLITGNNNGTIVAYDIAKNLKTTVATGLGMVSAIAFQSTGVLYATDYNGPRINKVLPNGMFSLFATVSGTSDGLAIDETRGRLYVADSGVGKLHYVSLANGMVTDFVGAYTFDGGYWPSPIAFDCGNTLLIAVNPGTPVKVMAVTVP